MKKLITFLTFTIFALVGFSQGYADYDEIRVRNRIIYNNLDPLVLASTDSILGIRNDTVFLIPIPSGGDTSYFDLVYATLSPKTDIDTLDFEAEVVYLEGNQVYTDPHNVNNVILGKSAASASPTHGSNNVGVGLDCLRGLTTGTHNTAGGRAGLYSVSSGTFNTSLGVLNYGAAGIDRAIFLGAYAGRYENDDNTVIIDNLDRSSEAASETSAILYSVTNATPASQITQVGGGGNVGFNTITPDSLVDIQGGANVLTDILVGGGWLDDWTPTISWFGSTPTAPTDTVARYRVTNNTVDFQFFIYGTNDAGSTIDTISFTLPITPADINAFRRVPSAYSNTGTSTLPTGRSVAIIEQRDNTPANRICCVISLAIANTDDYNITVGGTYEITGK